MNTIQLEMEPGRRLLEERSWQTGHLWPVKLLLCGKRFSIFATNQR